MTFQDLNAISIRFQEFIETLLSFQYFNAILKFKWVLNEISVKF